MSNYKLCYIDAPWAYFTSARLEQQMGDDWDDSPYEHNAGPPYEWNEHRECPRYTIKKIAYYSADLLEPCTYCSNAGNSPFSTDSINAGNVPWLKTADWAKEPHIQIFAGASIEEFKQKVWLAGGEIFTEVLPDDKQEEMTAYLAGPMEFSEDYGMGWRCRIREKLTPLGIRCILPNEEEAKFISSQDELTIIKKTDQVRYKNIMRQFIKQDLEFVESVDIIITKWEGERMSGTIGEAQHAYLMNQVSYLITSKPFEEIPGWFGACYDKIFSTEDECVEFLAQKYTTQE